MADILVVDGTVITMDPERRVIERGAIAIEGSRIVAVGPTEAVAAAHPAPTVIDARRKAVLPGLVDCHAHAGHGLVKTMGGDDGAAWYRACEEIYTRGSSAEFWHAEAALAALERLRFGVTCGVSLLGGGDSILRTDDPVYAARHCEAVTAVGIRNVLAVGPGRPPFPRTFRRIEDDTDRAVGFEQQLETCEAVIERWHGGADGRIAIAVVSPTIRAEHLRTVEGDRAAREALERQAVAARDLSRRHGLLFTQDGHERGSVRFAHETLGILGPDALLSHATDLDEAEIATCARTDTRIAHNPSAVASIRGRCPVPELQAAGVTVGLGSDGTAPDRSGDMFRHMQQCMHYHRRHFRDPSVLPPGRVLAMATIEAARALGLDAELGSLEVGKRADLVLVDLFRPHLVPGNMPLHRVVYFANGNDVDTVIVDGRVLMRDRVVCSVDEAAVLEAAEREAARMVERTGLGDLLTLPRSTWG